MALTLTDDGNIIKLDKSGTISYVNKPYDTELRPDGTIILRGIIERSEFNYSDVTSPVFGTAELLKAELASWNNTLVAGGLPAGAASSAKQDSIIDEITSKINRIKGSADYERALTYNGTGTENVETVTHTGTTETGSETVIETITYVDPTVNGSNITNIAYT